jgi:hypothetical protein
MDDILVYPMFPVSLDYPFLIGPSVLSNVYWIKYINAMNVNLHRYAQVIRLERKISLVFGREKTEEPIHRKTTIVNSYMYL